MSFIKKPPVNVERTLQLEKPVSELLDEYCRFVGCSARLRREFRPSQDAGARSRIPEMESAAKGNVPKSPPANGKA
jgi:hypothetical protein